LDRSNLTTVWLVLLHSLPDFEMLFGLMKLKDKVAIITGASRGIGRATAIELARNGANVTVNYGVHREEGAEVVSEIEKLGRRALLFQGNVADRNRDQQMIEETVATFGRVDILVANAASDVRKPFLDLEVADVEKTWAVSLWGVFHCCQLAARQMVKQGGGGSLVVVSSVHAFRPYLNATPYNAAKAAVNHMASTWAAELIQYGIRVNVVEPGWTDTPGERRFNTEEQIREGGKIVPIGRLARAEEIAKAVLFLASEEDSSYMVGGCLRVDGGFSLVH
jgi:glucose 1-dehydrogenase